MPLWYCLISLLYNVGGTPVFGQTSPAYPFPEVRIQLPEKQFRSLLRSRGQKLELDHAVMTVNGEAVSIEDLHLRGKTTLNFRRKSFSVALEEAIPIVLGGQVAVLKKFDLLNLAMDKNLWHNRWSFYVLSQLGIFPPVNGYCTLRINNEPQGIYLLVEKPQHAMEGINTAFMIRRGPAHKIEKEYAHGLSREAIKTYREQFRSLYRPGKRKAAALYNHLSKTLNTDNYFTWLGFNYLVMNGDYSDELFLYIDPKTGLYKLIAWDYDDLFKEAPHEGKTGRNQAYRDRLLFSLEDDLDRTIASDDFLYSVYLTSLQKLLEATDSTLLERSSRQVMAELQAVSHDPVNCQSTLYLDKEPFVLEDAKNDMERSMRFLKYRRTVLLGDLRRTPPKE